MIGIIKDPADINEEATIGQKCYFHINGTNGTSSDRRNKCFYYKLILSNHTDYFQPMQNLYTYILIYTYIYLYLYLYILIYLYIIYNI